jgi:hypothetical protein
MVVVQIIDCFDQPSGIVVRSQTYPTWSDPKNPKRQQQEIHTECQPHGVAEFVMEVDPEADEGTEPEASKDARRQAIRPQTKQVSPVSVADEFVKEKMKPFLITRTVAQVR